MLSIPPPKIVPFMRYLGKKEATDDNTIRRKLFACWIIKATDTHLEYVILIPFSRQQCLRQRASKLRYTYRTLCCFFSPPSARPPSFPLESYPRPFCRW
jgi:hypothetical protein